MKRWLLLLAAGAIPLGMAWADDPPANAKQDPPKKDSPVQAADAKAEFAAIQKDWTARQSAFSKKYQEATTNEERNKLFQSDYPKVTDYNERVLKLVETWPDAPEAVDAMLWAIGNGASGDAARKYAEKLKTTWTEKAPLEAIATKLRRYYMLNNSDLQNALIARAEKDAKDEKVVPVLLWIMRQRAYPNAGNGNAKKAEEILLANFLESKEISQLCSALAESQDAKAIDTLKKILDKNTHQSVKASACLALGKQLGKKEATQPEAEKYLERVLNDFPDVDKNVKNMAKGELNELRYLSVGKVAPTLEGKDLDDKAFKLTEYRGKVILLDFWGFW